MKKHIVTVSATVLLGSTLFAGAASAASVKVKKGDTLWGFSKSYGVSVNQIKLENGLKSDRIYIGQTLKINEKSNGSSAPSSSNTYKVVSGDSLWKVAKKFGTSVNELKKMNGLKTDLIRIGQVLKVNGKNGTNVSQTSSGQSSDKTVTNSSLNVDKLVSDAKAQIGTPYKWGGTSPSGFDCSGFIWYIINKQKSVQRTSTAGYWNMMDKVSTPAVGDFVFFTTYKAGPSHMGVYIGGNKFVHASSDGVTISDMTSSYWKPRYLGAKKF
jgi:peptidoglycan endopeptidase LytE